MKKASILLLLVLTSILQAFSQTATKVNEALAYKTAQAFIATHQNFKGLTLDLVSSEGNYIYNIGTQGFVMISGNTVLPPVLAWSNQGQFPSLDNAPENFASWIWHYKEMIDFAITNNMAPEAKIQQQWDEAAQGIFGSRDTQTVDIGTILHKALAHIVMYTPITARNAPISAAPHTNGAKCLTNFGILTTPLPR